MKKSLFVSKIEIGSGSVRVDSLLRCLIVVSLSLTSTDVPFITVGLLGSSFFLVYHR